MDRTKSKLATVLGMLQKRQIGTTTLMQTGTNNYDREFILIANTKVHAQMVIEKADANLIKVATLDNMHTFSHLNLPVAIDHHALELLLKDVQDEIRDNEEKIQNLTQIFNHMMTIVEAYQDRAHILEQLSSELVVTPWWQFKKVANIKGKMLDQLTELSSAKSTQVELEFKTVKQLIEKFDASNKAK